MEANRIRLLKGTERLTASEMKKFTKLDTILGCDSCPETIKEWNIDQMEEAKAELAKHKSSYERCNELYYIEEYALEVFEADEDGELIEGSDYYHAEEC